MMDLMGGTDPDRDRPGVVARVRSRVSSSADRVASWFGDLRTRIAAVDIAARVHERDRDAAGTLLGSALALRLFLFFVPMILLSVGLAGVLGDWFDGTEVSEAAGISSSLGDYVDAAFTQSGSTRWVAVGVGLFGVITTGWSLTRALVLSSALSWRLSGRQRMPARAIGVVVGLIVGLALAAAITNRIRQTSGIAVASMSVLAVLAVYIVLWSMLYQSLPRATTDPGAALPGAAIIGLTMSVLQSVTQFYLPNQIDSASSLYGSLGVLIAFLGWFFLLGRAIAFSFAVNAVVYEQVGSVSVLLFRLPGVRQIPRRVPAVARYFVVDYIATGDPGAPADGVSVPYDVSGEPVDDPRDAGT